MNPRIVTILVVDDDDVDFLSIQRGLKKAKVGNPVVRAKDGVEALHILRGGDGQPGLETPYVVLLDLNLPKVNGFEFLSEIRKDEALKTTVVFVLTTSDSDRDRWAAYNQHIAGYCLKTKVGDDFLHLIEMLDHYWRVVMLPE